MCVNPEKSIEKGRLAFTHYSSRNLTTFYTKNVGDKFCVCVKPKYLT